MTTAAGEHDWMAGLDWSMHGDKSRRFANPRQFLAVTLHRIAEYATGEWPGHDEIPFFLAKAGVEPRGAFRPADDVFADDGSPTTLYGDGLASAIAHAARRGIPLASSNALTRDEWDWIEWHGAWDWSCGEGARLVWSRLAPAFAELASSGRVETWIEPIDGGRAERLPASAWQLPPDAAVRRCARCAVNGDDPFARNAPATHHVFVDGAGLDKAIMETAFGTYMARLEPDIELPRLIDAADAPAGAANKLASTVSNTPSTTRVRDLPLNIPRTRNPLDMAILPPGRSPKAGFGDFAL